MLGPLIPFVVGTQILMVAVSEPPRIEVQAICRASEKELAAAFGNSINVTVDQCVNAQNEALERMKKNWATYPMAAKLCVQPRVYLPSYVEWLTCLEMDLDVRTMRTEQAKVAQAKLRRRDAAHPTLESILRPNSVRWYSFDQMAQSPGSSVASRPLIGPSKHSARWNARDTAMQPSGCAVWSRDGLRRSTGLESDPARRRSIAEPTYQACTVPIKLISLLII
jgi:hypothetical protein